jgi:hypothetical protein
MRSDFSLHFYSAICGDRRPARCERDTWLTYSRKIFRGKTDWKIQLNVRNLLNDNLLIPVKANPVTIGELTTREIAAYRIGGGRTWELTSTVSF